MAVRVARVYDARTPDDGVRVLVDRLWPRGVRKGDPRLDEWRKELAPSAELRQWYGHDPALFAEFRERYERELADDEHHAALAELRALAAAGDLTLVTATKDVGISQAAVLAEVLEPGPDTAGG